MHAQKLAFWEFTLSRGGDGPGNINSRPILTLMHQVISEGQKPHGNALLHTERALHHPFPSSIV